MTRPAPGRRLTRQSFLRLAGASALAAAWPVRAQEGTIRLVVGYPAGATSDLLTRVMAEGMQQRLNRTVVVENRTGAGGRIANELVKAAPPDGNTLMMTPVATMAIFPHSYAGQLRYDPVADFAPVAHLSDFQLGWGVATSVPARTLKEYVDWVKADPGKHGFYGSAAPGSIPHFLGVMFGRAAGIALTHVTYRGTAAAMQALAAGEIAALSTVAADIRTLVRSERARLLAVAGERRDATFPDVPTYREQGFDLTAKPWYGMFAPAGTPAPVIAQLSQALVATVNDPATRQRLVDMGLEPTGYGPDRLAQVLKADLELWGPVIRASGFKPE